MQKSAEHGEGHVRHVDGVQLTRRSDGGPRRPEVLLVARRADGIAAVEAAVPRPLVARRRRRVQLAHAHRARRAAPPRGRRPRAVLGLLPAAHLVFDWDHLVRRGPDVRAAAGVVKVDAGVAAGPPVRAPVRVLFCLLQEAEHSSHVELCRLRVGFHLAVAPLALPRRNTLLLEVGALAVLRCRVHPRVRRVASCNFDGVL
mmetsp:Transcript_5963/g.19001  ORF Transcript_5963/g.19001 Transcript_5963/m.19001 type:complete len:201 (-) Transcript_5963:162-764(-)